MNAVASLFTFQRERFVDVIDEAMPTVERQHLEAGEDVIALPLDVDRERYEKAEKAGFLRVWTVRAQGLYVGHAVYFVLPGSLHARRTAVAVSDMFGIAREWRAPGLGLRLLKYVEGQLRAEGVAIMHTQTNEEHPAATRLLEHLGHRMVARTYAKNLMGDADA